MRVERGRREEKPRKDGEAGERWFYFCGIEKGWRLYRESKNLSAPPAPLSSSEQRNLDMNIKSRTLTLNSKTVKISWFRGGKGVFTALFPTTRES